MIVNQIGVQSEHSSKVKSSKGASKSQLVNTLSIKYCIPRHVDRDRNAFLVFKSCFAQKQTHLKLLGQKHSTMRKLQFWIKDNKDMLYDLNKDYFKAQLTKKQKMDLQKKIKFSGKPEKEVIQ